MPPVLDVQGVQTYYGESHILHGVSLRVGVGEAVAVLGRNGAGKTTTMRTIAGFTPPREGAVRFRGEALLGVPAYEIARRGIGLVPQGRRIFAPLSVEENLRLGARPAPDGWTLDRVYAAFPRLRERARQGGGTLSGGEQQLLAVARALMTNPQLLLLDEPSEGLAPIVLREVGRVLLRLKEEGLSILLVEQNVPLALRVADRVYVMSKGQIVYHGSPDELAADENIKRRFLGVS